MIRSFLSKFKTLESIQASFTQAVDDLKNLRSRNADVISSNANQVAIIQARSRVLEAENAVAAKFQQNLENLLG